MAVKFNKMIVLTVLAVLFLILPACSRDKKEQTTEKPEVAETKKAELPKKVVVTSISGKILEVAGVGSGSFIFILLDRGEQQIWATVPAADVKVGEEVTLLNANIFKNFRSKSMNRTFDELIFSTGIAGKSTGRRLSSISPKQAGRLAPDVVDSSSPTK
ncbi:MAG: hypothetical protein KAS94_10270 [Desulfobulbaceae bacterium]|nr:hypothetical protein [Desulfobulbaceae bacterium]